MYPESQPESQPEQMQAFYAQIAEPYAQRYFDDLVDAPVVDELANALKPGARILDVGCGPGTFTNYLYQRGFQVEGVDLSPEMLTVARANVPDCNFNQMDMRSLDFVDNTFDAINALYCLIHIPEVEIAAVLDEYARVLRPGGLLLVIMQHGESDHLEDDPLLPGRQIFVNFTSPSRLKTSLEQAGFIISRLEIETTDDPESMSGGIVWALAGQPALTHPDPD